jgi:hypothetical protein
MSNTPITMLSGGALPVLDDQAVWWSTSRRGHRFVAVRPRHQQVIVPPDLLTGQARARMKGSYPECRATRGSSVKAAVGDRITVHGLHVGDATRCGEVLEVKGAGGEPPYVVRWDDGHEAVFVPGSGVRVDAAGAAADGEPG